MTTSNDMSQVRLTDEEVRAAIERALEIQDRSSGATLADLGAAAREVGISNDALAAAVSEVLQRRDVAIQPASSNLQPNQRSWWPVVLSTLAGSIAGGLFAGPAGVLPIYGLAVIAAFRAFDHRREGTQRGFQLEIATLWAAFSTVAAVIMPRDSEVVEVLVTIWPASAAIGATIIASRKWFHSRSKAHALLPTAVGEPQ